MSRDTYNDLVFICDSSLQSSFFRGHLENSLGISIHTSNFYGLDQLNFSYKGSILFIIDYSCLDDNSLDLYINFVVENELDSNEVIINSPKSFDSNMINKWPNIVGLFFVGDCLDTVTKGMKKVTNGELWLSRELTQEIIQSYRNKKTMVVKSNTKLTTREKEILQLLVMGASNNEIAESLFVSENTVKSHLYNVFKKINVKNRMQAFMWAKNNYYNDLPL